MLDLREKVDEGRLVGDRSIGTLLGDRGVVQPCTVREKVADLDKQHGPKYGVDVVQSLPVEAQPLVGGAYLRLPASMPRLAGNTVEAVS